MDTKTNTIKVLVIEPGMFPEIRNINLNLENLQSLVGGYIECVYPFKDNVTLIVNEEGKVNALPLNREIFDGNGRCVDIIAGTFIIAGLSVECDEDFCSLTEEQIKHYYKMFEKPKHYFRDNNGEIVALTILCRMDQNTESQKADL